MADPRTIAPAGSRHNPLSLLMQAKNKAAGDGRKINFCPFGCTEDDLDEHGYCRHVVGFTNDGKLFEPMIVENGRRVVRVKREEAEPGPAGLERLDKRAPILERVKPTDKLVQITISSRVYRDVDAKAAKAG